jgi:hypothetical protein
MPSSRSSSRTMPTCFDGDGRSSEGDRGPGMSCGLCVRMRADAPLRMFYQNFLIQLGDNMASGEWLSGLTSGLSITRLIRALTAPDAKLSAADSASTLFRFFRSRHVIDLRLIVAATLFMAVAHFLLVFIFGIFQESIPGLFKWISGFTKFFISYTVPAIPIYGGVIAWAYLAASTRLGTVDLFAAEISTLCRVGSVFDVGKRCVEQYDTVASEVSGTTDRLTQNSSLFVSKEDYFPVFAGNSRDLQALESSVVTHITAFYTFMKATRDSQRMLAQIIPPHSSGASLEGHPWHTAISDVIYMLFLVASVSPFEQI